MYKTLDCPKMRELCRYMYCISLMVIILIKKENNIALHKSNDCEYFKMLDYQSTQTLESPKSNIDTTMW